MREAVPRPLYLKNREARAAEARSFAVVSLLETMNLQLVKLRPCIERMLTFFVKVILQPQALIVGLDSANGCGDGINPRVHFKFTEFPGG
jgi:hypothetical protein